MAASSSISAAAHCLKTHLKNRLEGFAADFGIDLLVVENALSLPMNVPLAVALTELIAETNIATVAHHHDFWWERERFAMGASGVCRSIGRLCGRPLPTVR